MVLSAKNNQLAEIIVATWTHFNVAPVAVEVGLSGGVDSVVLTHLLFGLQKKLNLKLSAVYVHHGLSQNADDWAKFCEVFCTRLEIPFQERRIKLNQESSFGLEAEARNKRYEIYANSSAEIVALAHHADDLNETVLMNLLRGGGVHSLAAMPTWRLFNENKRLWRPLLGVTKNELQAYALENKLSFVEDESNAEHKFRRNWLRHTILPLLDKHIPHLQQHLHRSAILMQDAANILDEIAKIDLSVILTNGYFDCSVWQRLSTSRQKQSLLRFVIQEDLGVPRPESLIDFYHQLNSNIKSQIQWQLPHGDIYAYQGKLFISQSEIRAFPSININSFGKIKFINGVLLWKKHCLGLPESLMKAGLNMSSRQGGEEIALNVGTKSVKKILQEAKIPPFLREHWPLLFTTDNQCIAVVDVCVSIKYGCKGGYLPYWQPLLR